jgi:glutaredoxin
LRDDGRSERAIYVIDKNGIIRYIDIHDIDEQPETDILIDLISELEPDLVYEMENDVEFDNILEKDFILFCTSWCPDCKKARDWLIENKIDYCEVDVNRFPKAAKLVRKWADGNLVTPTIKIKDKIIIDYQLDKLRELLITSKKKDRPSI